MGDKLKSGFKTVLDPSDRGKDIGGMIDPGGKIIEKTTGSDIGRKIADPGKIIPEDPAVLIKQQKLLAKEQEDLIALQKQSEDKKLAEAKDEIARRQAVSSRGLLGRSLLTAKRS